MNYYTGIGSRETPDWALDLMEYIAEFFGGKGIILRSGGASGADSAFEKGSEAAKGPKEIYLPWDGFEGKYENPRQGYYVYHSEQSFKLAEQYHPNWRNLSEGAKKLMSRNMYQVLGQDLETPSDLVVCWTKGGIGSGGTGQALRVAKLKGVPVVDLGKYSDRTAAIQVLKAQLRLLK